MKRKSNKAPEVVRDRLWVNKLISIFDMEDEPLDNLIARLKVVAAKSPKASVVLQYYGYDGAFDVEIHGRRLETDQEMMARIAIEERALADWKKKTDKQIEKDRKEYERLRKKFEA